MAAKGPIPQRVDMLLGHIVQAKRDAITKAPAARKKPKPPPTKADWHPIAKMFYNSLKDGGMAQFYEQSDWALAYSLADDLHSYKSRDHRSANMLATIYSAMTSLGVAEGDRRRMQIELERGEDKPDLQAEADAVYDGLDD